MVQVTWTEYSNESPLAEGWYAVHFSWDAGEGSFIKPNYFDGEHFEESLPTISVSSMPFATKEEAEEWGSSHDISF